MVGHSIKIMGGCYLYVDFLLDIMLKNKHFVLTDFM